MQAGMATCQPSTSDAVSLALYDDASFVTRCIRVQSVMDATNHGSNSSTAARWSRLSTDSSGTCTASTSHPDAKDGASSDTRPVQASSPPQHNDKALQHSAMLLSQGHVVAIPTETVYGLAANALDSNAVRRIFTTKGRPADNPLIVHVSSLEMLASLYPSGWTLPPVYAAAVAQHWPGPLTILLPKSDLIPDVVTCGQPTVAVRMPSHPVAQALIEACGFPLAAPSANTSGKPSPTLASHVMLDLQGRIPLVLDGGACSCGVESTVLDALRSPPAVLRPGGATYEQLRSLPGLEGLQVYRRDFVDKELEEAPTTPGMKYRHYSPNAPVILVDVGTWSGPVPESLVAATRDASQREVQLLLQQGVQRVALLRTTGQPGQATGLASGQGVGTTTHGSEPASAGSATAAAGHHACGSVIEYVLGSLDDPQTVARELFSALRMADELQVDAVVVEGVSDADEGLAVMNRLRKAASHVVRLGV